MTEYQRSRLKYAQGLLQALQGNARDLGQVRVIDMAQDAIQCALDSAASPAFHGRQQELQAALKKARWFVNDGGVLRGYVLPALAKFQEPRKPLPTVERVQ